MGGFGSDFSRDALVQRREILNRFPQKPIIPSLSKDCFFFKLCARCTKKRTVLRQAQHRRTWVRIIVIRSACRKERRTIAWLRHQQLCLPCGSDPAFHNQAHLLNRALWTFPLRCARLEVGNIRHPACLRRVPENVDVIARSVGHGAGLGETADAAQWQLGPEWSEGQAARFWTVSSRPRAPSTAVSVSSVGLPDSESAL